MPGDRDHELGEERVCAVCSIPLSYGSKSGWHHPEGLTPWDHAAEPVMLEELASINWRCDFCNGEHARWVLPADSFGMPTGDTSVSDWCVCDTCKPAVEARDWQTIVDRVQVAFRAAGRVFDQPHVNYMLDLYRGLEQNITGPIRLNPPTVRKETP